MPILPRGLRFGRKGEVLNDFPELWNPELTFYDAKIPEMYYFKGYYGGSFDSYARNTVNVQVSRTPHRATVPVNHLGYRPVTTVKYIPTSLVLQLKDFRASWSGGILDGNIEVKDFCFSLPFDPSFDFESILGARFNQSFAAFNAKYGVILGEGKETLEYMLLLLRRLHEGFRAVRRGDFRALRRLIDTYHNGKWRPATAGNLWLEFRYGLTPLFHDIMDVMNDWNRIHKKIQKLQRFSAGHSDTVDIPFSGLYPGLSYLELYGTATFERRHRWGVIYADREGYATWDNGSLIPASKWTDIASALLNPLETAWELTPYSFVVDWFLNVGDMLEQQGQLYRNVDVVDGFSRRDYKLKSLQIKARRNDGARVTVKSFDYTVLHNFYDRVHTVSFPRISLQTDTQIRNIKHVIDAIFLLTQRVKR